MLGKTLLGPCNYYCGNCAVFKNSKCLACAKQLKRLKLKEEFSTTSHFALEVGIWSPVQTAKATYAKNMMREYSLKASSNT